MTSTPSRLSPADLAVIGELGPRATLLQLSSAFCAPCRAARSVLQRVAATSDGVRHVEVDVTNELDLGERWSVHRTPTVFVLDGEGEVRGRHEGVPRLAGLRELVNRVTPTGR